jgi:hypothetical protein
LIDSDQIRHFQVNTTPKPVVKSGLSDEFFVANLGQQDLLGVRTSPLPEIYYPELTASAEGVFQAGILLEFFTL